MSHVAYVGVPTGSAARSDFITKFALEGKTMARISHPSIVQVLDFGASEMPSGGVVAWMYVFDSVRRGRQLLRVADRPSLSPIRVVALAR